VDEDVEEAVEKEKAKFKEELSDSELSSSSFARTRHRIFVREPKSSDSHHLCILRSLLPEKIRVSQGRGIKEQGGSS